MSAETYMVMKAFPGHHAGAEAQFEPADVETYVAQGYLAKKDPKAAAEVESELDATVDAMADRFLTKFAKTVNVRSKSAPFNMSGGTVDGLNNGAEAKDEGSLGEILQAIGLVASRDDVSAHSKGVELLTNKYKMDAGGAVTRSRSFDAAFSKATPMQGGAVAKGVMQESQGTAGGFAVAPQFAETFFDLLYPRSVLLSEVTRRVVTGLDYYEPTWDYSLGGNGLDPYLAGMSGAWIPENAPFNLTTANIRQVHLKMNTFGALLQITRQLLQDAPRLQSMLMDKFAQVASYFLSSAVFGGALGGPRGFINAASALPVTRTASANGALLTDLATMFSKRLVDDGAASRQFWMVSPSAEKQLTLLNDTTGRLVFLPNFPGPNGGTVTNRAPMTLFGLPVYRSQFCSQYGSPKDIVLVDPSTILLGVRQDFEVAASEHYGFGSNLMTYRFLMRADAASAVNSVLTLANGDQVAAVVYLS